MTQHFFGYGSLVNRATHDYTDATPARLQGWERVWVQTAARPAAYLSVRPAADSIIEGLAAHVPGNWATLDQREAAYQRHPVQAVTLAGQAQAVQVYAVPKAQMAGADHYILLSYLDAVIQGFLREFGPEGAARFFATTSGWQVPIRNDRGAPEYPRAQSLTPDERATVDAALSALGHRL